MNTSYNSDIILIKFIFSSADNLFPFLAIKYFKSKGIKKIHLIQTDNGTEWTKALISNNPTPTLFERWAKKKEINLCRIRIATPRHNGKVERLHRKDQQRFYRTLTFYSFKEVRQKLLAYQKRSISYPITTLGFKSPLQMIQFFNSKKYDLCNDNFSLSA
jgi:hypothetical protein